MTSEQIQRWIDRASLWAYIVAAADAAFWVASVAGAGLPIGRGSGPDVLIFAALGFLVARGYRAAAVVLPSYWLVTKLALWQRFHMIGVLAGAVILGFVFLRGAHAVFMWHRVHHVGEVSTQPT